MELLHEGERIALAVASAVIGRVSSCEIKVTHPLVSRRHCRMDATLEGIFVEDLGSSNGTYVNGTRASGRVRMCTGDVLRIGQEGPEFRLLAGIVDGREVAALDPEAFEQTMMAGDAKLADLPAKVRVAPGAAPPSVSPEEAPTRESGVPIAPAPAPAPAPPPAQPAVPEPVVPAPPAPAPAVEPATTGSIPVAVPMDQTGEAAPPGHADPGPVTAPATVTESVQTEAPTPRAGLGAGLAAGVVLGLLLAFAAAVFTPWGESLPGWAEAAGEAPR
jgi:predicted component of type VI protein secretion system